MASYNKIILIGNLGRDPEVREYQGRKVANFSMAVNERYTKSDGTQIDRTEWFRVSFWGNTAEIAEKFLKKGSQVFIEGRLSTREYQDKDGITRTALEVSGQNLTLLGSSGDSNMMSSPRPGQDSQEPSAERTNENFSTSQEDDDLPF